ncbi:MAG: PilZ domain-containing protein, partial [Nitrospirota bacterium]|jgi:hypothetical protein
MARKKRAERFTKRLAAEFTGAGETYRGFVSNISETGLFIRTSRIFKEGSPLDITITLPDGESTSVKGIVRRAVTRELGHSAKNGMGIEVTHMDDNYFGFLCGFGAFAGVASEGRAPGGESRREGGSWAVVLRCPACAAGNRLPAGGASPGTRCVKCDAPLSAGEEGGPEVEPLGGEVVIILCRACGLRNRVRPGEVHLEPRCGGCREPLPTG